VRHIRSEQRSAHPVFAIASERARLRVSWGCASVHFARAGTQWRVIALQLRLGISRRRCTRRAPRQTEYVMSKNLIACLGIVAALIGSMAVGTAADQASQKFVKEAIEGNLSEVAVGKLAQEKGQSEGVRSFGAMLVKDHGAANEKATALANSTGVTPPTEPNRKQKAVYDKLSKLTADRFDREFTKEMVADHKRDIAAFEKQAKKQNDPAAAFASETLPTLRKHLEMAQGLASGKTASH
jgi:putative membrane protein